MDSGGDEHAALAVDDQSSVVVANVEWLEVLGGRLQSKLNCQAEEETSEPPWAASLGNHLPLTASAVLSLCAWKRDGGERVGEED